MKKIKVVVLGASNKPDRHSYLAIEKLLANGYKVILVHPNLKEIQNIKVINNLNEIQESIDTLTLYVNAQKSTELTDSILKLKPRRIIFNPGAENPQLLQKAQDSGIACLLACTLVLLNTGQF